MVYEIETYNLIGKILHTYEEKPNIEYRKENGYTGFYYKGTKNDQYKTNRYWSHLATTLPNNAVLNTEKLLPYFADVTQDLPFSTSKLGVEPKTWKHCQLMVEKHGNYLQFLHEPTGEVLRIAMNSNYYTPID